MTTPEERTRAVLLTREFLEALVTKRSRTPDVPDYIREYAYRLLRHYPGTTHLCVAGHMCSVAFGKPEDSWKDLPTDFGAPASVPEEDKQSGKAIEHWWKRPQCRRDLVAKVGLAVSIPLLVAIAVTSYFLR